LAAVTDAVHAAGGAIFVQLMHTGRASHQANLPPGARVVAPSAVRLASDIWVDPDGNRPASEPIAMTEADIDHALTSYADASALAIEAGFDGVELHAANGYLIDQFLNTASNQRTDAWGGSIANRIRFAVEAARRSAARIGGDRVGIRVSPYGVFNGMTTDPEHEALYGALASELSGLGLAYVHVVDHSAMGAPPVTDAVKATLRANFAGTVILSGGYDRARAEADLASRQGRAGRVRPPVPGQPRPGRQARDQRGADRPGLRDLLHARRARLHRLPDRRGRGLAGTDSARPLPPFAGHAPRRARSHRA
jgi:N-ethylmaleimide reductase